MIVIQIGSGKWTVFHKIHLQPPTNKNKDWIFLLIFTSFFFFLNLLNLLKRIFKLEMKNLSKNVLYRTPLELSQKWVYLLIWTLTSDPPYPQKCLGKRSTFISSKDQLIYIPFTSLFLLSYSFIWTKVKCSKKDRKCTYF